MSPTALFQTPSRAVDTMATGRTRAERLSVQLALPRMLCAASARSRSSLWRAAGRLPAPLGGLRPLRLREARSARRCGALAVRAFAGDEFDLGLPRQFASRYELLDEVLGEGSFGTVKAVRSRETGERFAVKMLPKSRGKKGDWERYVALLQKEVSLWTAAQNSHGKHIAKLRGVFEDDEYLYLVQDICEGGDLQKLIKEQGTLDEREAAQAISGVLFMLAGCHDRSICYGDVKPANFLLCSPYPCRRHMVDPSAPKGDIVLKAVDFGCSQKLNGESRFNKRTGTPLYMAPEIFFGWYGLEVDIWAAGMMLYQLLGGKLPFFGEKAEEFSKAPKMLIVQALMENELELTGGAWDNVSDEAKDLIKKMLDVDYNSRISAREALQHSWVQRYCEHPAVVFAKKEELQMPAGNVVDLPNTPGTPVA